MVFGLIQMDANQPLPAFISTGHTVIDYGPAPLPNQCLDSMHESMAADASAPAANMTFFVQVVLCLRGDQAVDD